MGKEARNEVVRKRAVFVRTMIESGSKKREEAHFFNAQSFFNIAFQTLAHLFKIDFRVLHLQIRDSLSSKLFSLIE